MAITPRKSITMDDINHDQWLPKKTIDFMILIMGYNPKLIKTYYNPKKTGYQPWSVVINHRAGATTQLYLHSLLIAGRRRAGRKALSVACPWVDICAAIGEPTGWYGCSLITWSNCMVTWLKHDQYMVRSGCKWPNGSWLMAEKLN